MLILSRKLNETLVIQDEIIITVLAIEGDRVKLGITAPQEVRILRHELWLAIQEQNQIAEHLSGGQEPASFQALREYLSGEEATEDGGENREGSEVLSDE